MIATRGQRGQTGTEMMLVISVIVIAAALAGFTFVPAFRTGVERLGADVRGMLSTGQGSRRAAPSLPNGGGPFRLPRTADSGCASGMVCLPESSSPLGTPVEVCRRGDNC